MQPPQLHISLQLTSAAGMAPSIVVVAPGIHGDVVTGTQGIGVRTPSAAAVAAATVGFAIDVQAPKGGMLAIGANAEVLADGRVCGEPGLGFFEDEAGDVFGAAAFRTKPRKNLGDMLESGVLPACTLFASLPTAPKEFCVPGLAEKSSIVLFNTIPVPSATTLEPKYLLID